MVARRQLLSSGRIVLSVLCAVGIVLPVAAATPEVDAAYPAAYALYVDLHQHPELSGHEIHTAAKLAAELRGIGYTVTEHVGENVSCRSSLPRVSVPSLKRRSDVE